MEFGILGPTQLIHGGRTVPLGPTKQRAMLAVLLHHAGRPVRADTIIKMLWARPGNADHRPGLYQVASRLRTALGQAGIEDALERVPGLGAYRLDVDPATIDLHHFRGLLTEARDAARRGKHDSAARLAIQALSLQRGEPLAELLGPQAEQLRAGVNETILDAQKLLAESWSASGRHHAVLTQLENLVKEHDLDEALARCWIRALQAVGRPGDARQFVIAFRRRYRKAMRDDPDLDLAGLATGPSAAVPHHLPPDIADFTGREALLAELNELRGPGGAVVVITGMPGVGKTTLARHWAHHQRENFPDGQLHLDAGGYGPGSPVDPHDALDRFLRTLGVPPDQIPAGLDQRRDRLADVIGERRILILIDNVLDSRQVRPLIPRSMSCLTIITSQRRLTELTIRDAVRTVTVGPLSEPESTALLARIVRFPEAPETDGLTALARLSGGLPLAVRIIGEQVAERPSERIGELADELRERLLDAADETSLTTVFTWSYRALRPDAARLFRRISLHPGKNITAEAAAVLTGGTVPDAEMLLTVLAKAHLVNHDPGRRYRFHDLLRRYANDRALAEEDPHDLADMRRRLLDWYLLSAAGAVAVVAPEWPEMPDLPDPPDVRPMVFATEAAAMSWCDAERDNLYAVSRWAEDHGYHRHGWQIPGVAREILERHGGSGDILRLNEYALIAARQDGHEIGLIGTLCNLGATYFAMHDHGRAAETFTAARQLAAITGHLEEETVSSHNLAAACLALGDAERAVGIYEQTLEVVGKLANPALEAATLHWLGQAYLELGHHQRAADLFLRALAIREHIGAKRGTGQSHSGLGALYLASGRLRLAERHCETALAIHVASHDQRAECDTLVTLGEIRAGLNLWDDAVRHGRHAVRLSEELADSYRQVTALTVLGGALAGAGDPVSAGHQLRAADRILSELSGIEVHRLRGRLAAADRTVRSAGREPRAG